MTCHEDGVSSVVGTILMLAVTVSVFGGFAFVVLSEVRSTDPPPDADLAFVRDGDRAILTHRGGEAIDLDDGFLLVNAAGTELRFELAEVAPQTRDGRTWRIGETLCLSGSDPPDPARPCLLDDVAVLGVAVVAGGGLVADEGERGGDAGPCPLDDDAPTASAWTFDPADLFSTSTGPVTVRFTASDDCSGVDDAVAPQLSYRIDDGSGPAYTSLGAMDNEGPGQWSGVVPAQPWNQLGGQTLQVRATGLQDLGGNGGGSTAVGSEPIDAVTLLAYVTGATATKGTIGPLGPAQDADDADGATALAEAGTPVPAGSAGPAKLSGTAQASAGATSPADVLASDDLRAELDATGEWVEATGFDLPSDAEAITALTIGYEGRKSSGGSPTVSIDYRVGAGAYSAGPSFTEASTVDTTRTRTVTGLSVADVEAMAVRVSLVTDTAGNPQVDHVFATVTYTTAQSTTYSLEVRLDFAGAHDGASETLDLRYETGGDAFHVEVWDGSAYTQRGTLSSPGSFATFTYGLTPAEFNGGAPRVRLVDATPGGTTAGSLQLDYARVVTV